MQHNFLLSIAIPTYNRAVFLENLLNIILPQAKELGGMVEICISNNCSTDNTREVVNSFIGKYAELINYNENEKNLGVDRNFIKVMEMSTGKFVWLLGDDDSVVAGGLEKVVNFVRDNCNENTGLINLAHRAYFIDKKTGEEVVYLNTVEKNKPGVYEINRKNVLESYFPSSLFMSVLLYNNHFLKNTLQEEKILVEEAIRAKDYIHTFLYQLMFLKYPKLEAIRFNEKIIDEELHYYKIYVEDKFQLHYTAQKILTEILLSSKYVTNDDREIITNSKKGLAKYVVIEMGTMRAFGAFNYFSFFGCLKMFFLQAKFLKALLFAIFFTVFSITPAIILRNLYKIFIKIKHKKNWQRLWLYAVSTNFETSKGSRRIMS